MRALVLNPRGALSYMYLLEHRDIKEAVDPGFEPRTGNMRDSQVLLAGVPGGFSRGSPVFAHLLIGLSHMS